VRGALDVELGLLDRSAMRVRGALAAASAFLRSFILSISRPANHLRDLSFDALFQFLQGRRRHDALRRC